MSDKTEDTKSENEPPKADKPIPTRKLYPLKETRILLGNISIATIYRMARNGRLKLTKIGDRSFVSDDEIERLKLA